VVRCNWDRKVGAPGIPAAKGIANRVQRIPRCLSLEKYLFMAVRFIAGRLDVRCHSYILKVKYYSGKGTSNEVTKETFLKSFENHGVPSLTPESGWHMVLRRDS
jgi:hypothetical protein